jgi:hypothetical protein
MHRLSGKKETHYTKPKRGLPDCRLGFALSDNAKHNPKTWVNLRKNPGKFANYLILLVASLVISLYTRSAPAPD